MGEYFVLDAGCFGEKRIFRLVALMDVLCFVFVYRIEAPGDINVTFYGVIFRELTHQESHLILFCRTTVAVSFSVGILWLAPLP